MRRAWGWTKGQWFWRMKRIQTWRLVRRDGGRVCSYCGCQFTPSGNRQRTLDHRVARAAGGPRWRLSNLLFACAACNRRKGALPEREFVCSTWLQSRVATLALEDRNRLHRVAPV